MAVCYLRNEEVSHENLKFIMKVVFLFQLLLGLWGSLKPK